VLVATAVLLVASILVGTVAIGQRDRAERAGAVATARELAAAASANVDVDPERSILLALEAVDRARSAGGTVLPEAEEALHRAVTASRIELRVPGVGGRLDWSPDGTVFVTEGPQDSGVVDIRDAKTGESLRSFHGHDGDIIDVAFNHDGTMLATTGADGTARIWDPTTGRELRTVPGLGGVLGPSFSADGSLVAAAWTDEGVVRVMDVATGRMVREFDSVSWPEVTSFDPTGPRLAISSGYEPLAVVVDLGTGADVLTLKGHLQWLSDVSWSPDGASIATAGIDGSTRIFDARTGRQRSALHSRAGHVYGLDWSPDATRLVTANSDGTARVWLVTERGPLEEVRLSAQDTRKGITGVAFSPDGTRVMTGDVAITAAKVWDVSINGDAEIANLPAVAIASGAVDFASDGRYLAASGAAGSVTVWDARAFTRVQTLGAPTASSRAPTRAGATGAPPLASGAEAFAIDVSRDGRLVAAARLDGSVRVWDSETGRDAFTVDPGPTVPGAPWMDVAWSPDGDLLAVAANDGSTGRVTILDRSGRVVRVLPVERGIVVGSVAFSPDGEQLITTRGSTMQADPEDDQVVIWDWKARDIERTIAAPAGKAVPSPTGHLIAAAAQDQGPLPGGSVDVWDSATGRRVATLAGYAGVLDLAFSPDGSRLATASHDGTVRIWDPSSGKQLLVLRGHGALVSSVAFSRDGSRLASVGEDGTVRLWALDLDDLVDIAEREVTRTLSDQECQQYLHIGHCP
jgi:WD40 repeat protein